ncbi:MAG: hypothetical protein A3C35_00120 [Omnitrophica bacterium RIFCSPHIGHO2_02_FULL_46_11]|nr:MAG: hypothetical protein A3C35_00120 [Omnitrophica bacterium RIFCSPHIGHO2_02_FULL_46_11]OGW87564.1 MAG: hypothetical protein A3A81_03345 [Omnitrophica bacterium RIFCSPLOWO2_01_FULL_45_10b]
MKNRSLKITISIGLFAFLCLWVAPACLWAAPQKQAPAQETTPSFHTTTEHQELPINYLFRDTFYVPPSLKLKYDIYETAGFLLVRDTKRSGNSDFSVVTGFAGPILEARVLKNIRTADDANMFFGKNARKIFFERIPIKELPLVSKSGSPVSFFWVGQRAFPSLDKAKAKIIEVKTATETNGGDFERALTLVTEFFPEEPGPTPEAVRANYLAEEELALKMLDWLDIGEKGYGLLQLVPGQLLGTALGEAILWQSFGDTSFRWTNFDRGGFNDQVGFYTNRIVFKGIRFFGEPTIDPFIEATVALETQGANFTKHLDLIAGLEYRPLGRALFPENFTFQGVHILQFMRNYRLFVQYMERKNLTDEIPGSADTDLWAGVDIFYEWGIDMDAPQAKIQYNHFADWVHDYVWGEYYGSYRWEKTDFSTVDGYNSWLYNSSVVLGIKWPSIALPRNPVNDELLLMPYFRFEHVTNPRRLDLSHQNRMFVAVGVRWMPFRSYQFEHNEWLFKTKFFGEYVGIGGAHFPGGAHPGDVPNTDWRVGVAVSFKRS